MPPPLRVLSATALAALSVGVAGCGPPSTPTVGAPHRSPSASVTGDLDVSAAASLREAFGSLANQFRSLHPGVRVRLNFGPSSGLARQITAGSPTDVFASASVKDMDTVVRAGVANHPVVFVRNEMEIAVPAANPGRVTGIADLGRADLKVALCQPQVPCGAAAAQTFGRAGVRVRPVTLEDDVKSVLGKVELGEVDAGIVYLTDVRAAGHSTTAVRGVTIPAAHNASTSYPIADLTTSRNTAAAQAFVAYVLSDTGRAVLTQMGFGPP